MIPVPWPVVVIYLLAYALAGMAIGAVIGWLLSRPTKVELLKDALLGSFGYISGFLVCAFMPWPENTVVDQLDGGTSVATTMNRYQHPHRVAIVLAIIFPVLHELYRWKKRKVV